MFAAGGYEATSLRQIAAAADVDIATLKYHFGRKSDLFAELFKEGHEALMAVIAPFLADASRLSTEADVRNAIEVLAAATVDFLTEYEWFARFFLYRLLEDASEIHGLEEELEGVAIEMIDRGLSDLANRGLIAPIDVRAFLTLVLTGLSIWTVACRSKAHWLGAPAPLTPSGRGRFEGFVRDILLRTLIFRDASTGV